MIKVAVVGAGFWGSNHLRVLRDIGSVELVGVCDIDVSRAEKAAKKYGLQHYFKDFKEMLDRTKPDAVTVCTPSTTHAAIAMACLDHGCDLLIEKPMASTVSEAVAIIDRMHKAEAEVMVGFIERFNPAVQHAVKTIETGDIGEVLLFYSRRIGWWPERIGDTGVVKDTAIHDIDLANWIFGQLPAKVYAMCGRLRHSQEDHAQIFFSFGDGRSALIEANWLTPRKKREMHVTGEKGVITVKFIEQEVVVEKAEQTIVPNIKYAEPLRLELEHFTQCVEKGFKPIVDAYDGLRATLLAECILKSSKNKNPVDIREVVKSMGLERVVERGDAYLI